MTSKKKRRPAQGRRSTSLTRNRKAKDSKCQSKPVRWTNPMVKKAMDEYLAARGIIGTCRDAFGARPLTPQETEKLAPYARSVPSMLFPYRDLDGKLVRAYKRWRYLEDVYIGGKLVRYSSLPNIGPYLYFAPMWKNKRKRQTWKHIAKSTDIHIYITEGEVCAAALGRFGKAAIGLSGVWSFLKNGKLLPEFSQIEWESRPVFIVFDNDITQKPGVRAAMGRLVHELSRLGARVFILNLPDYETTGTKLGIDDYLVQQKFAPDALEELCGEECEETKYIHWLNSKYFVVPEGSKVFVVEESTGTAFSFFDFRNLHSNIRVPNENDRISGVGSVWLNHPHRRQYQAITFSPAADTGPDVYNSWRMFPYEPRSGIWTLMRNHIREIICGGNAEYFDYIVNWMARGVQSPEKRAEIAIVLRGDPGTGKGIFANAYTALFAPHTYHASSPRDLTGRFNAHLKDVLVLFVDEAYFAGDKSTIGEMKRVITESTIAVEPKGRDRIEQPNRLKIIIASNEEWVIAAANHERRYFVLNVSDKRRQDKPYFKRIYEQLNNGGYEAMMYDLLNRDLTEFEHRSCPRTEALVEQQLFNMSHVQIYWSEILDAGQLPGQAKLFRLGLNSEGWGVVEKRALHDEFLKRTRERGFTHLPSLAQFAKQLRHLLPTGYPKKSRPRASDGTTRLQVWKFPPLQVCQRHFDLVRGLPVGQGVAASRGTK